MAEALLTRGAAADAKEQENWTPLHLAAQEGNTAVAEALLAGGAIPDAGTNEGSTPLHLEALLAGGAAVDAKRRSSAGMLPGPLEAPEEVAVRRNPISDRFLKDR